MPRTKPLYIYPSDDRYKTLLDELIDIHSRIQEGSTDGIGDEISRLVKEVDDLKLSTSNADNAIISEINNAKGVYDNINDRFLALDKYNILHTINSLTTTREYEYKDGFIQKEKVRGDLNFDVSYIYDSYGNIIKETKVDLDGNLVSERNYTYTDEGDVLSSSGFNTDDIMILSNSIIDNDQNKRLDKLEAIDFVELSNALKGIDVINLSNTVRDLATQVQHLMLNLPENLGTLIDTSEIFKRLDAIELRLDSDRVYYTFDVNSSTLVYDIPSDLIDKKFSVFMEGLLLERDVDYKIENGKITFFIPLIDDFTVSYKD